MEAIFNNKQILEITGEIYSTEKKQEALCNEVYFVVAKKGNFIIKIAQGKNRQQELEKEFNIIQSLKNILLLPEISLYLKKENYSIFVMEYIHGEKPTTFNNNVLKGMAKSLREIHSLSKETEFVNFDELIEVAKINMKENRLDLDEFIRDGEFIEPKEVLEYLKDNKPQAKRCLLHGDYRLKNMILNDNGLYILDWGLSFYGDPYYDLAIIKWYLTKEQFDMFLEYYGIDKLDEKRLEYNEWLSAFLNV